MSKYQLSITFFDPDESIPPYISNLKKKTLKYLNSPN